LNLKGSYEKLNQRKEQMKILKNCIELSSSVKIYVPSTVNVDQNADTSEWVDKALTLLAECFGGATCSDAFGVWRTDDKATVWERVKLCMAYCHQDQLNLKIDEIYALCLSMKEELKQQSVALEVNNKLYLI
jgi:hypothetical protein